MSNIGYYMINEAGITLEDFKLLDSSKSAMLHTKEKFNGHSKDRIIGYGILQTSNEKNRNGRIYLREDLAREIAAPRQQELLRAGQMCGEAGHPIGPDGSSLTRQSTIDPKNTCVRFLKFWMDGNNVMGYFEGTNNAAGETFDKDLRNGITPAFSLRALGTLESSPKGSIVKNLKMITYDYVIFPSHRGAYTKGILTESANMANSSSGFIANSNIDGNKSFVTAIGPKELQDCKRSLKESAIDYVKSNSLNYRTIQESMDLRNINNIDLINNRQLSLSESGRSSIIMNIEDYIVKEIQNYRGV